MKNLKNQKDSGEIISNFGPALLTCIISLVIIILFSSWMANFNKLDDFSQITRKYILKMETTGGLTPEDEQALKDDLKDIAKNITLDPDGKHTTRVGEVEYGEDIDLYVKADLYTYKLGFTESQTSGTVWQITNDKIAEADTPDSGKQKVLDGTEHTTTVLRHRSSTSKH